MDYLTSIWGILLFFLLGGILGWIIKAYFANQRIIELTNSINDRDNRLLAISRDHKSIIADRDNTILALKSQIDTLERSQSQDKNHIHDLRQTVQTLKSAVKKEKQNPPSAAPSKAIIKTSPKTVSVSPSKQSILAAIPSPAKSTDAQFKKKKKKKGRKKKRIAKLRTQVQKLKSKLKKAQKTKTIIKEIPIVIRKEVQFSEKIDLKKLKKMFSTKLPIIRSKKVINVSKKKGKIKTTVK